jgi:hypothetical protein
MKDKLGWPESLHAQPARVKALQNKVKDLEDALIAEVGYERYKAMFEAAQATRRAITDQPK